MWILPWAHGPKDGGWDLFSFFLFSVPSPFPFLPFLPCIIYFFWKSANKYV